MTTAFKIFGIGILVILLLAGLAVLSLPYMASTDLVKSQIAKVVKQKTGRNLTINGSTTVKLFPKLAVQLNDIELGNPEGVDGPPIVKMAALQAYVKPLPLLSGRTEVEGITFDEPQIQLHVDTNGATNWAFNTSASADTDATKRSISTDNASTAEESANLGLINIKHGVVRYTDARTGLEEVVDVNNLMLEQLPPGDSEATDSPVKASADLVWRSQDFNVAGKLDSLYSLIDKRKNESHVTLTITSNLAKADYDGRLSLTPAPTFKGKLKSEIPSVRKLAAWTENPLPNGSGFGRMTADGTVEGTFTDIKFDFPALKLDDTAMKAKGQLQVREPRPRLVADVETDKLDLNPYLTGSDKAAATTASANDAKAKATPIKLDGLKAADGKINLRAKQILYNKAKLENAELASTLNNGRLDLNINKLALYRGTATGGAQLDGGSDKPVLAANLKLNNVLTGAILRDFAGFEKVAGLGDVNVDLKSAGTDTDQLLAGLNGTAQFKLHDGRIEGVDLGQYVGGFSSGDLPPGFNPLTRSVGNAAKPATGFDEMSGRFNFEKGFGDNKDFLLTGNFFKVRAAGRLNLIEKTLNFRVAPKLFSGTWSFTPSLRITGPWWDPRTTFDALAFLVGSNDSLTRTVTEMVKTGALQKALQTRGLKSDAEIEAYLAGDKIDVSKESLPAAPPAQQP